MNDIILFNEFSELNSSIIDRISNVIFQFGLTRRKHSKRVKNQNKHNLAELCLLISLCMDNSNVVLTKELILSEYNKKYSSSSYSENIICCILSGSKVGIDIEKIGIISHIEEIYSILSEAERKLLVDSDENKLKELVRTITLKECYGKFMGVGLNYSVKSTSIFQHKYCFWKDGIYFESIVWKDYIISYCSLKNFTPHIRVMTTKTILQYLTEFEQLLGGCQ